MILIFSPIVLLACLVIASLGNTSSVTLVEDSLSQIAGNIAKQAAGIFHEADADPSRYSNFWYGYYHFNRKIYK
ncbi:hypothetical protein [Sporosarcina sp. YIM B06819]|uniref:hypothetical protein n=1 Tax=Sporosarcina sp. YIM B06819 TaxID=3081769 RepID=UPI00298BD297|nr:hypothetical protein [Sporosarcina sp. YIM B06819]